MEPKALIKKGILLTIVYAFIMSITALVAKQLQTQVAVFAVVFWQSVICLIILLPQMKGRIKARSFVIWKIHLVRSVGGFAGFLFYYWSLNHIPLVEASLLRSCAPLCVPLVVLLIHKIGMPRNRWLPMVVGFIGVALIIQPIPSHINPWHLIGFLSALGLALSMVTTRMLSRHVTGQETLFVYFFLSCVLSAVLASLMSESLFVPMGLWPQMLVVGLTLYVGMFLYNKAYSYAPASVISPISYIGVVFSGLWGLLVWQHLPDVYALSGMVLIFISILISARMVKNA
ncbi:DMT family transporter [Marinomonas sp.]